VKTGKLLIIAGPSAGVGKDTILRMFLQKHPDWQKPLSVTTRLPRQGETHGSDYEFTNEKDFKKRVKDGEFLEWEETVGNLYGTPQKPLEDLLKANHSIILRKDVRGAISIKKKIPHAITVCLLTDDWQMLEERLRQRGTESEAQIKERLGIAQEELKFQKEFDSVIINPHGHPELALEEIEKVVGLA
jgi:guanylate kinase